MNKLTIGFFIDTFYPMVDGVVMVVDNYARRLCKDYNVIVFCPKPVKGNFDDSVFPYKVVRCNSLPVPFIDYNLPLPEVDLDFSCELNKYKLDIVHIHSPATLGKMGIKYAKKHNSLLIGTLHSQYKQDIKRALKFDGVSSIITRGIVNTFNKCDEVWTVNNSIARLFKEEYGYKRDVRIMQNASSIEPIKDVDGARCRINELSKIDDSYKVLLFVGRLNKLKNIFFIIDALVELEKLKPKYKYKMIFVGSGQDEEDLKKHISKNNLNDKVILTGKITDRELLAMYYRRADLFLFPSWYDANSLVQIEAASQETPTLFIEKTATSYYVDDNINGFLAENTPVGYAKRINEILSNDKLLEDVSHNALRDIYKSWDDIVNEVSKLYIELLEKKRRGE